MLAKESREHLAPGTLVEVEDAKIHVFSAGSGPAALVFFVGAWNPGAGIGF